MSRPETFDTLVKGGKLLAWHIAQSGRRTAVIERRGIGVLVPTSRVCPARTRFGTPGWLISCGALRGLVR
jgi:hypothetical protein